MTLHLELHPAAAALPMLLVAAATLILGAAVLARERASAVTLSFFLLTVTVWMWLTGISLMAMAVSAPAAFVIARFAYAGIALIPAAVLQFTTALTGMRRRALLMATWCGSAAFGVVFVSTRTMLAGTWRYSWGFYPRLNAASALFLVFFGTVLGYSLVLLARARAQTGQERRRNVSFFGALAVGYLASIDYLPAFGVALYPLGFIPILGFIVLATRAVVRFRLADLTPSFVADMLLDTMHGGVMVVDTHGCVRVANDVAAELLGWSRDELRNADLRELLGVEVLPATDSDSFARNSRTRNQIAKWRRRDGGEVELTVSATALRDPAGEPIGVLYAISDLADRRRAERNEFGATHDFLTRLPNRSGFAAAFDSMKARVANAGRTAALFFIDLDGFKDVNDRYGHLVGDSLLQLVATRLRNAIRGTDLLARYGGDEFVLLLDLARAEDATLVGNKLIRTIGNPYTLDEHRVRISASIGAAFYPADGATVEALVRAADAAMYSAKRSGKSRLRISRDDIAGPPPFGIDARA